MSSVPSRAVPELTTTASSTCDDVARRAAMGLHPAATGPSADLAEGSVEPLDTAVLDDIAAGLAAVATATGAVEP